MTRRVGKLKVGWMNGVRNGLWDMVFEGNNTIHVMVKLLC